MAAPRSRPKNAPPDKRHVWKRTVASAPKVASVFQARAKVKQAFVDAARKYSFPDALSVSFVARGNSRYLELSREGGDVFGRWHGWLELEVKHASGK